MLSNTETFCQLQVPYRSSHVALRRDRECTAAPPRAACSPPRALPGKQPLVRENGRTRRASERAGSAAEPRAVLREDARRCEEQRRRRAGFLLHRNELFGKRRKKHRYFCRLIKVPKSRSSTRLLLNVQHPQTPPVQAPVSITFPFNSWACSPALRLCNSPLNKVRKKPTQTPHYRARSCVSVVLPRKKAHGTIAYKSTQVYCISISCINSL